MTMRIPELSPFFREWLQENPNEWLPQEEETTPWKGGMAPGLGPSPGIGPQGPQTPAVGGPVSGGATAAPPVDTSYAAFKAAYKKAFGRDITQAEMNDNGTITIKDGKPVYTGLYQLSNDLIRLLPLGRLVGFDARRLSLMSGRDLLPLFKEYPNALFDFGTDYLSKNFSSTEIQGFIDSMKKLQPTHPSVTELQNVVNKVEGKPPVTQPPGPKPPVTQPPVTQPVSSKWQIPSLVSPTAAGKTPLELYLSMIGAKQPGTTQAGKARIFEEPIDELPPSTGSPIGGGGDTGEDKTKPKYITLPNGDLLMQRWTVDRDHPAGYWADVGVLPMPKAATGGKSQAEIDADLAATAQQIEASKAAIEQAKANYELAKTREDREAQYASLNYLRSLENAMEQAQTRQAELELQRQQLTTQRELGFGELGLKTQAQLGYADVGKDIPTLERELAVAQANLNNFKAIADSAYQAGNIALAEQAQAQAAKEYDRTQTLTEEIQRGQLGLQTAGVTGAYGGMPTLEAEIRRGQLGLQAADVLGAYAGMPTLEAEIQRGQLGLQTGALTGQYGGMPTLEAQAQAQQFGLAQAGVTGTYGGAPTLQSLRQQADIAYQAAQVAFAQGNFEEGQRQFNISSGLARQAQEFSQAMQTAQMEREVMASPIGLIEQIYRARGQAMPALAPSYGAPIAPQAAAPLPEEGIARFGPPGWTGYGPTGMEPKSERDFLPVEASSPFLPERPVAVAPQGGATPGRARVFGAAPTPNPELVARAQRGEISWGEVYPEERTQWNRIPELSPQTPTGRILGAEPQAPTDIRTQPDVFNRPNPAREAGFATVFGAEPSTQASMPALQGDYIPSPRQVGARVQGNTATLPTPQARAQSATPQGGAIPTRMEPLSWDEINRSGLQLPAITQTMAGREPARYRAGMPLLAPQAEQRLLPSERRVFTAELGAMGVNPEDYYFERNRQAQTGTPYRRMPTVRRRQRVGGFV